MAQATKNLVAERMKILGELWNAGIAAEMVYKDNANAKNQVEFALENGIPLVLFIGEDELSQGVVKVKELNTGAQTVVKRSDMIAEVKIFIEKNPVLLSKDELKLKPEQKQEHNKERRSSIKPPGSPKSNKGDVKFNAGTKDKKANKEFEKKRDETKTKISSDTLKL